jgi:hypothetical protein
MWLLPHSIPFCIIISNDSNIYKTFICQLNQGIYFHFILSLSLPIHAPIIVLKPISLAISGFSHVVHKKRESSLCAILKLLNALIFWYLISWFLIGFVGTKTNSWHSCIKYFFKLIMYFSFICNTKINFELKYCGKVSFNTTSLIAGVIPLSKLLSKYPDGLNCFLLLTHLYL